MQIAKPAAECLELFDRHILIAEKQDLPVQKRPPDVFNLRFGRFARQIQTHHFTTNRRRELFNFKVPRH